MILKSEIDQILRQHDRYARYRERWHWLPARLRRWAFLVLKNTKKGT